MVRPPNVDEAFQKRKFTELRLEYYSAGRALWFSDSMSIGGMLLGYAVELSLKYALIAVGLTNLRLLRSHQMLPLWRKCIELKALPSVEASDDLLQYVSDTFNQRYPSQVIETSAAANVRGHALSQSLDAILAYDDLVIQLDESLRTTYSDNSLSIAVLAAHFINRAQGRTFFHCNVAALRNTDTYRQFLEQEYAGAEEKMRQEGLTPETIAYNLNNHRQRLDTWKTAPESIWHYAKVSTAIGPDFASLRDKQYAKSFTYPGRVVYSAV